MNKSSNNPTLMFDKFIDNNSALIFIESALSSMAQTGNFEEKDVGEGLTVIMRTIISDYQVIKQFLQDHMSNISKDESD